MDVYLDPSRPRQLADTLYEQVRAAIAAGRLAPGDRLPTSRWLADDLGVARSTVTTVFGRLVAEGLLTARTGDGTYVAEHPIAGTRPPGTVDRADLVRRRVAAPRTRRTIERVEVDLRTGRPDSLAFPLRAWRRAVASAVEHAPPGYGDPAGAPMLRAAIASWVSRSRGLDASPDQVLVTAGAQQAFDLCAQVLAGPGDVAVVEQPGYEPARRAFAANGLAVEPVPVDREGIVASAIPRRARLVYVTPSHQSPTGVTLAADRRRALLELSSAQPFTIVEDDYDTEFRFVDRPLEPLRRLDPHGAVVYLGTFSKTLSPSLRIGFVVAAPAVIEAMTVARQARDVQPPQLTQAALTQLLVGGELDRHIRRQRAALAPRHHLVARRIAALHADGLAAAPWPSNAGLHAMVELAEGADAERVCERLGRAGILVESTADNWIGVAAAPALAIGFGLADEAQLDRAFDVLAGVLADEVAGRGDGDGSS